MPVATTMTDNISLVVSTQPRSAEPHSQQKPRPLGRVRIQGQKSGPTSSSGHRKSEDFSVHGEAYSAVEKQPSSSSLPPITSQQQQQQQLHQRQSSIQSSGSPPSDAARLARQQQQREQELLKKLQDASTREKLLKEQVDRLEKMVASVQKLLADERLVREGAESELTRAADSENKYRRLYEEECKSHEVTKQRVEELREQHSAESARLQSQIGELKGQLEQLKVQHDAQVGQLRSEHQQALSDRDKRIDNLKRQVAGALGTNSHERQSQIDQLNKELQKMVEEVEALRKRAPAGARCQQCPKKDAAIKDQGEQVRQLNAICQRFRGQLNEQEQMLIMLLDKNSASGLPNVKR